jgi:hypothetical protein
VTRSARAPARATLAAMAIDHLARAPENLAGHLRGRSRPRARGLARAWAAAVDWAEGEAPAAAAGSLDVDLAEGEQLRRLAALVGAPLDPDEGAQLALVRAQLLAIRSRGTGDDLLGVMGALWPGEESLEEIFPAGIILGMPYGVDPGVARVAAALLARARIAAVHSQLRYSLAPEAETFRLAPDWPAPDPVLDAPGATQLAQLQAAVGAAAQRAWFGALADAVAGATLTASGGALAGVAAGSPARSVARLCLSYSGANDQHHVAPAGVGEVPASGALSVVLVFWLPEIPTTASGLLGKQNLFLVAPTPRAGWNVLVPAGGARNLLVDLSDTAGGSLSMTHLAGLRVGYNALVLTFDRAAQTASSSLNGSAALSVSIAGLSYVNAQPLTVGDSRVNRSDPAPVARVPVVATFSTALPAQAACAALLLALHGSSSTGVRGLGNAAQTTGGKLAGVLQA